MIQSMFKVQVVTSAFNEGLGIATFINSLIEVFEKEDKYFWELIIFDNSSTDNTWDVICEFAKREPRVLGYQMMRTFDLDNSLTAGIDLSDADAVILMTSDMQDPPSFIPALLREWEKGYDQVLVRVTDRQDRNLAMKLFTRVFYFLLSYSSQGSIPRNVSDFRLISRKVVDSVRKLREQNRFLRGIIAWTGGSITYVDLIRPRRITGKSNVTIAKIFPIAIRAILANSSTAISTVSMISVFVSLTSVISIIILCAFWVFVGVPFSGFGTLIGLILVSLAIQSIFQATLLQYVGLIYNESKNRPLYLIKNSTKRN